MCGIRDSHISADLMKTRVFCDLKPYLLVQNYQRSGELLASTFKIAQEQL